MESINNAVQTAAPIAAQTMAPVATSYKYSAYDSQLPITVPEGMRLVKCLYKENRKTGTKAGENSYILVPEKHLDESVVVAEAARLAPYVSMFLQDVEDKLIKAHHTAGGIGFNDSWLGLDKILEALEDAGQSNRLNKEKIESWYDSAVLDNLALAFSEKLGIDMTGSGELEPTEAELEKLAAVTGAYKAKFASLASGKTVYRKEEAELLQRALVVAGVDKTDSIGARFYARLEGMKAATVDNLLLAL